MEYGFNMVFKNKEDLKKTLDAFIDSVERGAESEKPSNLQKMQLLYSVLRNLTEGTNIKLFYELYVPFKTSGSIVLKGKTIKLNDPEVFAKASCLANNVEVYPLDNENVCMAFAFHGIEAPVE